ncbi:metabotropic glutamate receptor-like [Physella acuta]|uniref:metabotropic glutamate receptor-like n=1 Tax=Physella acuta TaxID=109671 RepID=UPI0027DD82C1|nr:metabotropic glutamate receptor-like [Physella acuta]
MDETANRLQFRKVTLVYALQVIVLVLHKCEVVSTKSEFIFHSLDKRVYSKPGDINIGAIVMATQPASGSYCTNVIRKGTKAIEYSESVAYVVDAINRREDLLPNITLGFYILNDCTITSAALAQSLKFLPTFSGNCAGKSLDNATCVKESDTSYDVIGVLAPLRSGTAAPVSLVYTPARIPLIGAVTSSDEFSDKKIHPYFFRVIGPDKFQVNAMLNFVAENGWSYISVVYIEGPYGESALNTIKSVASSFNICLATWIPMIAEEDTDVIAKGLVAHRNARVVIVFMDEEQFVRLVRSVDKQNASGHFIWLAGDSIAAIDLLYPAKEFTVGTFLFSFYAPLVNEFYSYIQNQNISKSANPWFKPNWESLSNCSFNNGTCANYIDESSMSKFDFLTFTTLQMDSVLALAHGAHKLISDLCPGVTGTKARACVKREILIRYLKNLSFTGYSGRIQFDNNGDSVGRYVIQQITDHAVEDELIKVQSQKEFGEWVVAYFDVGTRSFTYTDNPISWRHIKDYDILSNRSGDRLNRQPESVCSKPCGVGEYRIQKVPVCCWECRACRDNERVLKEGCEDCEVLTWPDPDTNYTTCIPIPLTHTQLSSTISVLQISFAVVALLLTCAVSASYVYLRDRRVIKAASRELSQIQILAISVGYVTVICYQTYPTHHMCSVLFFTFCLSFASLYSPLLIKAVRIYRIFKSGTNRSMRFVSPKSQILMSLFLILIQLVLCVYVSATFNPTAKTTQPVLTEKFVELSCDMTLPGLSSFLAYNLILVSLCSVFAFKTRKLPDNFNESRFISMCVSTTLVIWLAFIPTYFTAGREYVRVLLLSVSLILNHTVALVFLFLPKVYAAVYLIDPATTVTGVNRTVNRTVNTNSPFVIQQDDQINPTSES